MKKEKDSIKTKDSAKTAVLKLQSDKEYFAATGYRKRAAARVRLYKNGKGEITVNKKSVLDYFQEKSASKTIFAPMKLVGVDKKYNLTIIVRGGGKKAQISAARHGIARALDKANADFHTTLKKEGYLTRDPREKERKKPGLRRARRAPQWAKR